MAKIPQFDSLEEAAEFWDTHDFEDYVDATEPVTISVSVSQRKKSLTVPLPLDVYEALRPWLPGAAFPSRNWSAPGSRNGSSRRIVPAVLGSTRRRTRPAPHGWCTSCSVAPRVLFDQEPIGHADMDCLIEHAHANSRGHATQATYLCCHQIQDAAPLRVAPMSKRALDVT